MKRSGKRLAALLLSIMLIVTCSTVAFASEPSPDSSTGIIDEQPNSDVTEEPPEDEDDSDSVPPVEDDISDADPVDDEPIVDEPVDDEPIVDEPADDEPIVEEPVVDEPEDDDSGFIDETYYSDYAGELTAAQKVDKLALAGTAQSLEKLEVGVDYHANEAVFMADTKDEAEVIAAAYGATLVRYDERVGVLRLNNPVTEAVAAAEDVSQGIPAIYPNYRYEGEQAIVTPASNDPKVTDGTQEFHNILNTADAWADAKGDGVQVAVIDSGINTSHEDLTGNIAGSVTKIVDGYNGAKDNNGHGSHVSGIIAAKADNKKGGAGVAPKAKIFSIKVLEGAEGTGWTADIIMAVNNAASNAKTRIINMSLGGTQRDEIYLRALKEASDKGIIIVVAAGNSGHNLDTNKYYPACYSTEVENLITVAALNYYGTALASTGNADGWTSNYSTTYVNIAAPGTGIYSSVAGQKDAYDSYNGTSKAAPMVSGVLALIISANPDLKAVRNTTNAQTALSILMDNSTTTVPGSDGVYKKAVAAQAIGAVPKIVTAPKLEMSTLTDGKFISEVSDVVMTLESTAAAGTEIFYTTNGKKPSAFIDTNTEKYTGSINLSGKGTKNVKAVAVYLGRKSPVTTLKVTVVAPIKGITLAGSGGASGVQVGKSLKIVPTLTPKSPSNSKLTWEMASGDETKGAVKNGTFTPSKTYYSTATAVDTVGIVCKPQDVTSTFAGVTLSVNVYPRNTDTVFDIGIISSSTGKAYVAAGKTLQLLLSVNAGSGNKLVTWSTSNAATATVSASGKVTGKKVSGRTPVVITATPNKPMDNTITEQQFSLTVYPATTKVTVAAKKLSIYVGDTTNNVTASSNTGTLNDSGYAFDYTSSKPSVATVDGSGNIAAVATGKTTIKAIAIDGTKKSASVAVTVVQPAERVLVINKNSPDMWMSQYGYSGLVALKKSISLSAMVLPYNTTSKKVKWTSSNDSIATVNASGKVTGKTEGTVTIKATTQDGSNLTGTVKILVASRGGPSKVTLLDGERYECPSKVRVKLSDNWYVLYGGITVNGSGFATSEVKMYSQNPYVADVLYYDSASYSNGTDTWAIFFNNKGTVKVTVKTVDGSNKSKTVTFIVE